MVYASLLKVVVVSSTGGSVSYARYPIGAVSFVLRFLRAFGTSVVFLSLRSIMGTVGASFIMPVPSVYQRGVLSGPGSFPVRIGESTLRLGSGRKGNILLFFGHPVVSRRGYSS